MSSYEFSSATLDKDGNIVDPSSRSEGKKPPKKSTKQPSSDYTFGTTSYEDVYGEPLEQDTEEPWHEKSTLGKIGSDIKQGTIDVVDMGLRGARAFPGGPEIGGMDKEQNMLDTAIDKVDEYRNEAPDAQTNKDGEQSAVHSGIRSAVSSLGVAGTGAGIGIAATSWIPVPGARVVGGIVGGALGLGGFFGGGTADESYQRFMKDAEAQGKDITDEKVKAISKAVEEAD